jgi:hypothetical protein
MKTLVIVLIAAIVFSQLKISAAASSENSAVRDLAAAKFLGVRRSWSYRADVRRGTEFASALGAA